MDDYTILKFASLFHDIGKFYQRADDLGHGKHAYDSKYKDLKKQHFGKNGAHGKWSADFVKNYFNEIVESLVLYHHNPKNSMDINLGSIVQIADHHSSKERIESDDMQEVLETPLISIFSRVTLNDKLPKEHFIPLVELDFNKSLHPNPNKKEIMEGYNLVPEYKNLWKKFVNEINKLKNKNFESCLALMKKYTSTMPSAPFKSQSDISIYDHSKTTVAIANCRYLYSRENKLKTSESAADKQKVYRIINGDISGIQNFIYRVNSPKEAQKGMNKRLRGRSLYLTLLSEAIATKIIDELELDSSNILFCGGGRFTIIAPNTVKTSETIEKIDSEVNNFFIKQFNSELFLAIVSKETDGCGLGDFGTIIKDLGKLITECKKHKFVKQLNNVFEIEDKVEYKLCVVCGNKVSNDSQFCPECLKHENLGQSVANAKYLIKYINDAEISKSDLFIDFLNVGFIFKENSKDIADIVNGNQDVKFIVYKLNDTDFLEICDDITSDNVSFDFKVFGNSIPKFDKMPLYFNHLAEISKGSNKLGVLKMDVDNLGRIFSNGFDKLTEDNPELESGASISRISSLSFYLDLFFSGRINQIVSEFNYSTIPIDDEKCDRKVELDFDGNKKTVYIPKDEYAKEFRDLGNSTIHINYSGGDDLLVVGPYDDVIKFAQKFKNKFDKWTANNDSINISAGISIVSPKFPIGKAALIADDELEKSKDCGKDKITVFGEVLGWKTQDNYRGFNDLIEFGEYLEGLASKNKISKGFIYSLLKIWRSRSGVSDLSSFNSQSWKEKNAEKSTKNRYVPTYFYKLRNIDKDDREIREKLLDDGLKNMPWIKTPVSWASLRLR